MTPQERQDELNDLSIATFDQLRASGEAGPLECKVHRDFGVVECFYDSVMSSPRRMISIRLPEKSA